MQWFTIFAVALLTNFLPTEGVWVWCSRRGRCTTELSGGTYLFNDTAGVSTLAQCQAKCEANGYCRHIRYTDQRECFGIRVQPCETYDLVNTTTSGTNWLKLTVGSKCPILDYKYCKYDFKDAYCTLITDGKLVINRVAQASLLSCLSYCAIDPQCMSVQYDGTSCRKITDFCRREDLIESHDVREEYYVQVPIMTPCPEGGQEFTTYLQQLG